jgi:hypothetical protein
MWRQLWQLILFVRGTCLPPPWKCFPNPCGLSRVRWRDAAEKLIRAGLKMLRKTDERGDAERILAALDTADGLRMDADQLGKTLLRQIRPQSGVGHVAANDAEQFLVGHPCLWSV